MAPGESDGQERTEQPTAKRQEDARRKGQVAKSSDLTAAALLMGALGAGSLGGARFVTDTLEAFQRGLGAASNVELTPTEALALLFGAAITLGRLIWPFILVPAAAALAVQILQTRFSVSWSGLVPQWDRVNPLKGLGRLLSPRSLVEALKAVIKLAAITWPLLLVLGQTGAADTLATIGHVAWNLWVRVGLTYLALAALDYAYQWSRHRQSLQMTREEVREESKETEGNPQTRARVRALHRQRVMRRMMAEVKRADVVVRNPIHFAVALRYEGGQMRAPKVVAKGALLMARRIVEIAQRHGVPVIENPPLARALFRAAAVGQEIPRDLYKLVAEVLAYVYSRRKPGG
jgi:flagellar biosynthesis protein FlhB